ncbi:TonB-dependent receptor plug domain-containing protein [Thermomonas sp.]
MTCKTTTLRKAILLALTMSASAIPLAASAQAAQEPAAKESEVKTLAGMQVTGSRIRQTDVETSQPVMIITREEIEKQGFQSVGDILQNITATGNPPLSRASPSSSGPNAGGTYISLRDLGAERTLVLINGRRMGVGINGRADLSLIPAAVVESIEVLKDGASSTYGSDAIAGVINIITRTNFDGSSLSAYYGQYDEGDGAVKKLEFVTGVKGERGSLTFAAEWAQEDRVAAVDRPWSRYPRSSNHPDRDWSTTSDQGGFVSSPSQKLPNVVYSGNTRVMLRPGGNPMNRADYINQNTDTGRCNPNSLANPGPGVCTTGSTAGKHNVQELADTIIPRNWHSVYIDGVFELNEKMRVTSNVLYTERSSTRLTSGRPLQANRFGVVVSKNSYFNVVGEDIGNWWRRTQEVPRRTRNDLRTLRFTTALEGNFEIGNRWFDWDVSYVYNKNNLEMSSGADMGLDRIAKAVGPSFRDGSGKLVCGTPAAPIAGCVPWNPFIHYGTVAEGGLTGNQALQDYLFHIEQDRGTTATAVLSANLSGSLVQLPAGELGFAVGAEHRKESGSFTPDAMSVAGMSTNQGDNPTRGDYSVKEIYAEFQVPLLADLPFAKELTLNLASRYSNYDTFGSTTNHKIGMKWKPIEQLLLRATISDGFRAPTISDMFAGTAETAAAFTDPCDVVYGSSATNPTTRANCRRDLGAAADTFRQLNSAGNPITSPNSSSPIPFYVGSNPLLNPETSRSKTVGAVWSPSFLEGFNITLDWWNIRINDTIVTDTPKSMLDDCYVLGISERCGLRPGNGFSRDPVNGTIVQMQYGDTNAGFRDVEGYDLDLSYRFSAGKYGDFRIQSSSTYMVKDLQTSSDLPQLALSSTGWGSDFRLRSNMSLIWEKGAIGATFSSRFFSSMQEACVFFTPSPAGVPPVTEPHLECNEIVWAPTGVIGANGEPESQISRRRQVGANTFHDLQLRYQTPWDARISVGVNNLFKHEGPVMYSFPSSGSAYYGGFDQGRFLYMRYTQKF